MGNKKSTTTDKKSKTDKKQPFEQPNIVKNKDDLPIKPKCDHNAKESEKQDIDHKQNNNTKQKETHQTMKINEFGNIIQNELLVFGYSRRALNDNKDIIAFIVQYFHEQLFISDSKLKLLLNNFNNNSKGKYPDINAKDIKAMYSELYILIVNIKDIINSNLLNKANYIKLLICLIAQKHKINLNQMEIKQKITKKKKKKKLPSYISDNDTLSYFTMINHNPFFKEIDVNIQEMNEKLQIQCILSPNDVKFQNTENESQQDAKSVIDEDDDSDADDFGEYITTHDSDNNVTKTVPDMVDSIKCGSKCVERFRKWSIGNIEDMKVFGDYYDWCSSGFGLVRGRCNKRRGELKYIDSIREIILDEIVKCNDIEQIDCIDFCIRTDDDMMGQIGYMDYLAYLQRKYNYVVIKIKTKSVDQFQFLVWNGLYYSGHSLDE